ncbi:hypothetical protein D9M69_517360 [compost metagenome]
MRHNVKDLAIRWNLPHRGHFFNSRQIIVCNFVVGRTNCNHAVSLRAKNMSTVDTHSRTVNLVTAHALSLTERVVNSMRGTGKMGNNPFAHTTIWGLSHANNSRRARSWIDMPHNSADCSGTNINTYDVSRCFLHVLKYTAYGGI